MANTAVQAFKAAGLPAVDMASFKRAVAVGAQAAKAIAQSGLLLRLLKDGIWVYGPDNVEVEQDSLWAINPFSMSMGYAAWGAEKTPQQGKLLGERMANLTEPQPVLSQLPDVGAPWKAQVSMNLVCLSGEDVGTEVLYKTTSVGGTRAYAGLLAEVSKQLDGDGKCVPIVDLLVDSYQNKTWGKTYVPVLDVKEWKAPDDTTLGEPAADDEAQDQKADAPTDPPTTRRHPAAAAAEPNTTTAAAQTPPPVRNRRGAAAAAEPEKPEQQVDRGAVVRRRRR